MDRNVRLSKSIFSIEIEQMMAVRLIWSQLDDNDKKNIRLVAAERDVVIRVVS